MTKDVPCEFRVRWLSWFGGSSIWDPQPVGLERPALDPAGRAYPPHRQLVFGESEGLVLVGTPIACPKRPVDEGHIEPEESEDRPRTLEQEHDSGGKAHRGDEAHHEEETDRAETTMWDEDGVEEGFLARAIAWLDGIRHGRHHSDVGRRR